LAKEAQLGMFLKHLPEELKKKPFWQVAQMPLVL
jgi:hypothetical protein